MGGQATFRFRDGQVELVSATPNAGFRVEVQDEGPFEAEVRFVSSDHESRIDAEWEDGEPRVRVDERPEG